MLASELGSSIAGVILHSDCGSTYVSYAYRKRLEELSIMISMGSKRSCYDNAAMESINGIIKDEALYSQFGKAAVNGKRIPRADIARKVKWFINYYNNQRCKKCLGKLPPVLSGNRTRTEHAWLWLKRQHVDRNRIWRDYSSVCNSLRIPKKIVRISRER